MQLNSLAILSGQSIPQVRDRLSRCIFFSLNNWMDSLMSFWHSFIILSEKINLFFKYSFFIFQFLWLLQFNKGDNQLFHQYSWPIGRNHRSLLFVADPDCTCHCTYAHVIPIDLSELDALMLHDARHSSLNSYDETISWRKLATTDDVVWILMFSFFLFFYLSTFRYSASVIVWHTRTKKQFTRHTFIYTEDTVEMR